MPKPVRLQLSRRKGSNLQAHSLATNGLPAVNVARPSKWGNPFRHDRTRVHPAFRYAVEVAPSISRERLVEIRGKNLACFCRLDEFCHADVLLELANA